jgi:hypothetical protein
MNTAAAFGLFLLGSFALIFAALHSPSVQYYTGGIVIALFIAGLFLAFGLTIQQSKQIKDSDQSVSSGNQANIGDARQKKDSSDPSISSNYSIEGAPMKSGEVEQEKKEEMSSRASQS